MAQSIKFRCLDADDEDEVILEVVVPHGQSIVTLDLPSVSVRIEAEARSVLEGTGQVLAEGGVTVLVKEARVTAEKLTLDSGHHRGQAQPNRHFGVLQPGCESQRGFDYINVRS